MFKFKKLAAGAFSSAMERETISKNRVSPKNVRSRGNFLSFLLVLIVGLAAFTGCTNQIPVPEPETPFVPDETTVLTGGTASSEIYGNYYQNNTNNSVVYITKGTEPNFMYLDIVSAPTDNKMPANGKYSWDKEFDTQTDNSAKPRTTNTFGIRDFVFKFKYYSVDSKIIFAELNVSDAENGKKYELNIKGVLGNGNGTDDETDTVSISFIYEGQTEITDYSSRTAEQMFSAEPNGAISRNITGGGNNLAYYFTNSGLLIIQQVTASEVTLILLYINASNSIQRVYQINNSGNVGTMLAPYFIDTKKGIGGSVIRDYTYKYYYPMSGTLTIGENEIVLNAVSYHGKEINITYTGNIIE